MPCHVDSGNERFCDDFELANLIVRSPDDLTAVQLSPLVGEVL